jgi:hypothetical protein
LERLLLLYWPDCHLAESRCEGLAGARFGKRLLQDSSSKH